MIARGGCPARVPDRLNCNPKILVRVESLDFQLLNILGVAIDHVPQLQQSIEEPFEPILRKQKLCFPSYANDYGEYVTAFRKFVGRALSSGKPWVLAQLFKRTALFFGAGGDGGIFYVHLSQSVPSLDISV